MSTVDERVVEMAFKNSDFIKNVQATITVLQSLKDKLNFKGAEDSLNSLDSAGKKFSLSGIASGVDSVASKFSSMGIAGITVLSNLVNRAVDAGISIAKSLTIDPIKAGLDVYETKINSIQTILANTGAAGTTLSQVTAALNELNTYANQTVFSFADMTKNIGTFTAAGVSLNTSVSSIKGIANLAALSGASAEQASSAMYQLSQAIAAGSVKLQDWNSVVNAGLGGKTFQTALENTARATGVNIDAIIAKAGSFRQSLQTGWLTSDILTKTLAQFTGDLSLAQIKAMGFTDQEAQSILALGKTAVASAVNIRTITQLMAALKEEVATAWSKVWEVLVGNITDATTVLTKVHNILETLFTKPVYDLAAFLQQLKDTGALDLVIQSMVDVFKALSIVFKTVGQAWSEIFPPVSVDKISLIIQKFEEFTNSLIPTKNGINDIRDVFVDLFSAVKIVVDVIGYVAKGFDGVGSSAASGGKSIFAVISYLLNYVNALLQVIEGNIKLQDILKGLGEVLSSPIKLLGNLGNIFSDLGSAASKAYGFIEPFISKLKDGFSGLGQAIADSIKSGNFAQIENAVNEGIFGLILLSIKKFINNLGKSTGEESKGFFATIKESFEGLTGALKSMQTQLKAATLEKIAIAVGLLAVSIIALSFVNVANLTKSLTAITVEFGQLVAAMLIIDKFSGTTGFVKLPIIAASIILLAGALLILSAAVVILGHLSWDQIVKGLTAIGVLLAELTATILLLGKNPVGLYSTAASIEIIAVAMNIMAAAVAKLGALDWQTLGKGVGTIAALLLIMAGFNAISAGGAELITTAVAMVIVGAAINVLSAAIASLGKQSLEQLAKGLGAMAVALLIMAGGLALMEGALPGAAALIVAAEAITILSAALVSLGGLSWDAVAKALVTLAGSLLIIGAALIFMEASLPGSAALLVAAAALAVLAPVLLALSTLSWEGLAKSLIALAGAFTIIGVAGLLLTPLIPALLGLGAAITLLGVGILAAGLGVAAFGVGIGLLAASGAAAFGVLVAGIEALLGVVPQIITTFGNTLTQLANAIKAAAPAIINAFTAIMVAVLGAITTLAPKIAVAATALITAILSAMVQNSPKIVSAMATLAINTLTQLTSKTPSFIAAGVALIVAVLNGISANVQKVVSAATLMVTNFIAAIGASSLKITQAAATMIITFINGLATQINNNTPAMRTAGLNLALAIINGMTGGLLNSGSSVINAAVNMAKSAVNAAKNALGINSPSKEFQYVGEGMGEGTVVGIDNSVSSVEDSAANMGAKAVGAMQKSLSNVNDAISSGIDLQPTITPIIDLTQAKAGFDAINGLNKSQLISANTSTNKATSISADNAQAAAILGVDPSKTSFTFVQNNTSPRALDAATIYRQTKNQLSIVKEALPS